MTIQEFIRKHMKKGEPIELVTLEHKPNRCIRCKLNLGTNDKGLCEDCNCLFGRHYKVI